jgi:hypothetical protein
VNEKLKKLKDGTGAMHRNEVVWFDVWDGSIDTTRKESGEVYWPFALVWNCTSASNHRYDIAHLPSGYWFVAGRVGIPRRRALALVRKLRTMGDWNFSKPKGPKWEAIRASKAATIFRAIRAEVEAK